MNVSPPERSADRPPRPMSDHSAGLPSPRIVHLAFPTLALALLVVISAACDDPPVVDPDPEPISPKIEDLKDRVESLERKVSDVIDSRRGDVGVSNRDASD